jgi:hypothetical protein
MNPLPTVYELRKQGWKVKVGHHRNLYVYNPMTGKKTGKYNVLLSTWKDENKGMFLAPTGGKTIVSIRVPEYEDEFVGEVFCSKDEKYNKSIGLKKALARALASYYKTKNAYV